MSKQEDIEFLRSEWKSRNKEYRTLDHLGNFDLLDDWNPDDWQPSEADERCFQLAEQYKLDGKIFVEQVTKDVSFLSRRCRREMAMIYRIIAAIQLSDAADFGPDPHQHILYWDSKPYKLSQGTWKFLLVVWGRKNVPFEEINEQIWGDDKNPGTIRKRIADVNNAMTKHGIDLIFSSETEKVSPLREWPK